MCCDPPESHIRKQQAASQVVSCQSGLIISKAARTRMIIDFHCHYSPEFFRYREHRMELDALVSEMDRHGVARTVLCAAGEYAAYSTGEGNAFVAAAVRRFPDRFIGFATVNPW